MSKKTVTIPAPVKAKVKPVAAGSKVAGTPVATKPAAKAEIPFVPAPTKAKPAPVAQFDQAAVDQAVAAAPVRRTRTRTAAAKETTAPVAPQKVRKSGDMTVNSFFVLADIARPVSGPRLFAHTMAALHVLGMLGKGRPAVRTAALQAFVGARAVKYHTQTKMTFEAVGEKTRLSVDGAGYFGARQYDKALFEGFVQVMQTGVVPPNLQLKPNHVAPAALAL